jgi:hypothetical protein
MLQYKSALYLSLAAARWQEHRRSSTEAFVDKPLIRIVTIISILSNLVSFMQMA